MGLGGEGEMSMKNRQGFNVEEATKQVSNIGKEAGETVPDIENTIEIKPEDQWLD